MPFLVVEEKGNVHHYPVSGQAVSIGRAPDNTIMLTDDKSSRHHCVLEHRPGRGWVLRDLNSRNGTFLGGKRVTEAALEFGDAFRIGTAKISLQSEEAAAFETQKAMDPVSDSTHPRPEPASPFFHESLRAFAKACEEDTPSYYLQAIARFIASLVPKSRVAVAMADEDGNAKPVAFANFISGTPADELPPHFRSHANRMLNPNAKAQSRPRTQTLPACVYAPFKVGDRLAGLLYVEREGKGPEFTDAEVALLSDLGLLSGVAASAAESRRRELALEAKLNGFREELDKVRGELEAKLDMQTAELTALRLEAEGRESKPWQHDYSNIITQSAAMQEVFRMLDKVTDVPVPVLILGEPGTGKELIARALHFNSSRAKSGRFVAENCAALPDTLFESELYGYVKGAFTGAERDKIGLFGMADGGTIFLDEIGEISPAMQAKLLRVLEEGEIRPIGGKAGKKVDFRLVCATNKDLAEQVRKGAFRQDLFFRINVVTIRLPALRERKEDIPLLVDHFLKETAQEAGYPNLKMDRGVLRAMANYEWPGNVRELENEVKKMVALSDGKKVDTALLSPHLRRVAGEGEDADTTGVSLKDVVENVEKRKILEAIDRTKGNKSRAAEMLGLSRLGLRKKMERYGIHTD